MDYRVNLLITKFYTLPKKKQHEFLEFCIQDHTSCFETMTKWMSFEKLGCEDKNFVEGDMIMVPTDLSCYPRIDVNYYEKENLIIDNRFILVKVKGINPMNGLATILYKSTDLDILSEYSIGTYQIPKQEKLNM